MACLEALPAEVLCEIAEWLVCDAKPPSSPFGHPMSSYARDHSVLARSCRRLYSILNPPLYKRNIQRDAVLNSCLLWAAARGLLGTIKTAHELGADLDLVGPQSRDVLAKGWNGIPGPPSGPVTPLHLAVSSGELHVVEYLLEHGAAVHLPAGNCCDCLEYQHRELYALHMALTHSSKAKEAAAMLIRHGAYLVSEHVPAAEILSRRGHHDLFQLLLEQRCPQSTMATLKYSLRSRNLPLFQDLLRRPDLDLSTPPSSSSSDYPSLLGLAVYMGITDAVRALLSRPDVDPKVLHKSEWSPLESAAREGHVGALHALLTMRPDIDVNATDDRGRSPFHWAAIFGHVEVLKALTQYPDVKVDSRDKDGQTPLQLAAYGGNYGAVRFLIKHPGVQPLVVDAAGLNVLHCLAIGNLMMRKVEQFKEADEDDDDYDWTNDVGHEDDYESESDDESSSETSSEGGDQMNKKASPDADMVKEAEQTIRELMSIGIPIDQESPTSETAFRIAIRHLNYAMAIVLLACGCDHTIGFEEASGWTLLHECLKLPCRKLPAKQSLQTDLVRQLVGRGVNIEAAHRYDPDFILRDLEERYMFVNVGATPLWCAAGLARNTGSMEVLLEAGADPNADIERLGGYSEPMIMALYGQFRHHLREPELVGVFGVLVKHGAKLDEAGGEGKTALEMALDEPLVVKEMLDHATSETLCREHVQSVIDEISSRKKSRKGVELLGDLKDFRDRVFGGE